MSSIFRSEKMALCQLFLSSEASYNCVSELGELGLVQFRDLNANTNAFQRKFVHEIRRCEEMERKLRYLEKEAKKANIRVADNGENPDAPQPREMIDLEATFEKLENELHEVNANARTLKRNFLDLTELKYVLESSQEFFQEKDVESSTGGMRQNLLPAEEGKGIVQLGFVAGVIPREKMPVFERMLWRVCRGNVFVRQEEIADALEDPFTGEFVNKIVYLIFFQGEQLKNKVKKICEGCRSTMYPCPETNAERKTMLEGVTTRLDDLTIVLQQTTDHQHRVLTRAAKHLRFWLVKVRKIKGIYHTLNMFNFDVTNKCLIAEAWIPEDDLQKVKLALSKGTERSGSTVEPIVNRVFTKVDPPTFHRLNKFTKGFQALIDAYGVASYREVNPGLYTTISFPFLFAIMFGDCGHGLIMFSFALWMVLKENSLKKTNNEIWNMFFNGRYIILLMGAFSIYTGFIYNDVFSKSLNIFGTNFHVGTNASKAILEYHLESYTLDPGNIEDYEGHPYPIGLDPMWQLAMNKISYMNSYKMKISIIIGVVHMLAGVMLSLFNNLHFKRTLNIICEFIPQLVFLLCMFGYLCILVLYKYIHFGAGKDFGFDFDHDTRCAPSVLIHFIDMVLVKHEKPINGCKTAYLFEGQYTLQKALLVIALLSVPFMLLPKPLILYFQNKKKIERSSRNGIQGIDNQACTDGSDGNAKRVSTVSAAASASHEMEDEEEEFEFSEVFIHQTIHTIEYVLGSVSHTASYLRLWALSLAHAQLSEVLWMMVLRIGLAQASTVGCIILYLVFAAWAFLTISILVLMEGLSAFLHCLRLHWVEFCSKFYSGQGYLFSPFKFKKFINEKND